jgi:hypothetical protein
MKITVNRRDGEKIRLAAAIERARLSLQALKKALDLPGALGSDATGAIVSAAVEISIAAARHDAFVLCEYEALPPNKHLLRNRR